ncbi:mutl-like protein 1 [Phaeodactylum tricornutum CCAP 1055/1]|uniref:Mutl-like protein 1 n=3 Tax=Phaeodactylum tricornutum TaxID=2850 RepID=B7FV15_PHATC|nr:mutl-like protein 1 [Phaeodactylum tricornutum CCAP 1055/1]EEC49542.1 mutl-like protein 1 [Phaeodactylum tricornutum CCAP 1055/1]|eukprot:XP_002178844.1 mutl-like protein 1 [Phaeodactylum tricornutum CCAP 1055/1]
MEDSALTRSGEIQILPQEVVDKIAAGEVVQRPVSVVKELVENALDAGATEVIVTVEKGGLAKITIADNGGGIRPQDLPLAATRHATSKLRTTEDFAHLCSFGFRGEALASVSMVSHLCITSRVPEVKVGYKLAYRGGKPLQSPKPTARKPGTTVLVEDLFFNLPHRKVLRPADEYNKILTVLQHYSILYAEQGIGLVCQKSGKKSTTDLNTSNAVAVLRSALDAGQANDDALRKLQLRATQQVIAQVFGSQLISHLQGFDSRGTQLVLFINSRLVECNGLKRVMEDIYSEYTKIKPFLYLRLDVPPDTVDVNVHPTKKEVALLYLDEICKHISSQLRQTLSRAGQTFEQEDLSVQSRLSNPYKRKVSAICTDNAPSGMHLLASQQPGKKSAACKLIRTDQSTQVGALEPYLVQKSQSETPLSDKTYQNETPSSTSSSQHSSESLLDTSQFSIRSLRKRVRKRSTSRLEKRLRTSCWVGVVSRQRSLVQVGEDLVLMNHLEFSRQMFYQLALDRFGGGMNLAELGEGGQGAVDIQVIIAQALQLEEKTRGLLTTSETNSALADQAATCLMDNSEMLEEYFSIAIEKDDLGRIMLKGLPVLLEGHCPQPHGLALFLLRLATEVDWSEERLCFHGVCRELGAYYSQLPSDNEALESFIRHTLFPAISTLTVPPTVLEEEGCFQSVTKLSKLFRVFERC